jgi:predicted DsbA family dithiol-disulfide isomerase
MRIEIYADVLCPWSYIAKRRIETALAGFETGRIGVIWRSFELSPESGDTPGESAAQMIRDWRGDAACARIAHIEALGAAEGLTLDLERARPVNTFDAHRLVHLGAAAGKADAVMERLLRAYHCEGVNVAGREVLARLGMEAGLDGDSVTTTLAGNNYADAVRADERSAAERGITGVPMMVIAGSAPISAVQPVAALLDLLRR